MSDNKTASKIVVDHDNHQLVIDGEAFPFWLAEEPLVKCLADGRQSVTVEIFADRIEQVITVDGPPTLEEIKTERAARHEKLGGRQPGRS